MLDCIAGLRDSWTTGLTGYLAGKDCRVVAEALRCDTYPCRGDGLPGGEFDPSQLPLCLPVYIYLGVRFV